jgi:hypothetical protein
MKYFYLKNGIISDRLTTPDLLVQWHVNVVIEENKLQGSGKKAWGQSNRACYQNQDVS